MATQDQVASVLKQILWTISQGSDYFIFLDEREENEPTLTQLGWTPDHAIEVMKQLRVEDYCKGPEPSKSVTTNKPCEMWFFGKEVHGLRTMNVYIKFAVFENKRGTLCTCVSFHETTSTMNYPFKSGST